MSLDVAQHRVDDAVRRGAQVIQLTGGEPLCYDGLIELVAHCFKRRVYSMLATSGFRHSPDLYSQLKRAGLTAICVSVNDADRSVAAHTRDAYDTALGAIRDAKRCRLLCFVNLVLTDENIDRVRAVGEQMREMGVCGIHILRPVESFDGRYVPTVSPTTLRKLHDVVEDDDFYRVENCFLSYWRQENGTPVVCEDAGKTSYFVNVDGSVSPCSKMTRYRYADVREMDEARDEWERGCCCAK